MSCWHFNTITTDMHSKCVHLISVMQSIKVGVQYT